MSTLTSMVDVPSLIACYTGSVCSSINDHDHDDDDNDDDHDDHNHDHEHHDDNVDKDDGDRCRACLTC